MGAIHNFTYLNLIFTLIQNPLFIKTMEELIKLISENTELPSQKSVEALFVVAHFIKEKYPLMSNTIDTVLGTQSDETEEVTD